MDGVSIIPFNGKTPRIDSSAFIAPGCRIIGDVEIGPEASVWYNCVLRADVSFIRVGARSNIQDGTIVHCESEHNGGPYGTIIGDDVLIGHTAIVHGCTLKDRTVVGMGAIVMNQTVIEPGGMLAAGAMLTTGKVIGANEMWAGRPAKLMRVLTDEQVTANTKGAEIYRLLAKEHAAAVRTA
jgi:gamma-carbonic anhydrase